MLFEGGKMSTSGGVYQDVMKQPLCDCGLCCIAYFSSDRVPESNDDCEKQLYLRSIFCTEKEMVRGILFNQLLERYNPSRLTSQENASGAIEFNWLYER